MIFNHDDPPINECRFLSLVVFLAIASFFISREAPAREIGAPSSTEKECDEQIQRDFRFQNVVVPRNFKNQLRHESDKRTYKNGDVFIGYFKGGKKTGYGSYYYKSGEIYQGNFLTDKRHGLGRMVHDDGRIYVGMYFNDKKDGRGTLYQFNGKEIRSGIWRDGHFASSCP